MGRKITKKIAIVLLWVLGVLIALDLILVGLFFIPKFQNAVVDKVTSYITQKWGSEISIGSIYLTPTLKLVVRDFHIKDYRDNDMIRVNYAKTRIKYFKKSPISIAFGSLRFDDADVIVRKYVGDESVNIALWAEKFKSDKPKKGFILRADRLEMTNSRFLYVNDSSRVYNGGIDEMDYSYFEIKNIDFHSTDFTINSDDISFRISDICFDQYTGFKLLAGKGNFRINNKNLICEDGHFVTPYSSAFLDLTFNYYDWSSYSEFVDSVMFDAVVRPSSLSMKDIACFAPSLKGMDETFVLTGLVKGPVNKLNIDEFVVHYGNSTSLAGDLVIGNAAEEENLYFNLNLLDARLNISDLLLFTLPGGDTISIPKQFANAGAIKVNGYFFGELTEFETQVNLYSDAGDLFANLVVDDDAGNLTYEGRFASQNFNLGKILPNQKYLGIVSLNSKISGTAESPKYSNNFSKSIKAHLEGDAGRFDFYGYPIKNITFAGLYGDKKYDGKISSLDTNFSFNFTGLIDLNRTIPNFKSFISLDRFAPGEMLKYVGKIDTSSSQNFDKFFLYVKKHPNIEMSFESLELNISGDRFEGLNGYVGVDGLNYRQDSASVKGERIRLTAINTASGLHKFILKSNFVNATMTTNYELNSLFDSLAEVGYRYFPNLLPEKNITLKKSTKIKDDKEYYFNFFVQTFRTREILALFYPGMRVAPLSTVNVHINSKQHNDSLNINIEHFSIKEKVKVENFVADGHADSDSTFILMLNCKDVILPQKKNDIVFSNIGFHSTIFKNIINYDLTWNNPASISKDESRLSGYVNALDKNNILAKFINSSLYVNSRKWTFNENHLIHLQNNDLVFDNVTLKSDRSQINVNGVFSFSGNDNLNIDIKNVDLSQINTFASNLNMKFGGDISAKIKVSSWNNARLFTGKLLVDRFVFNDALFGNLFLAAAAPQGSLLGFGGGIFHRDININSSIIDNYTLKNYNDEKIKLANLSGVYNSNIPSLEVKANIDTLRVGFLSPFLESFSQIVSGNASGELTFIAKPDSTFFNGKVKVIDGLLGIAQLNTVYKIQNQTIEFNNKGFEFKNITLSDIANNKAILNGHVYHHNFKDFKIDLTVETDKILALNTVKQPDTYFYGVGFVKGKVTIVGDEKILYFKGNNLKTLAGSKLYLPVTFSDKVYETEGVRFKVDLSNPGNSFKPTNNESDMVVDFDFIFDVTRDAEVQLDLDPSIGGTLLCRSDGKLRIEYNSLSNLNLTGMLTLFSGKFAMSLKDVILNTKFDIVSGGTVTFNGPIENSTLNAQALYKTTASLTDIIPDIGIRRTQVHAFINLNGNLMSPNIGFSFELPNASNDINSMLYSAIDTSNVHNVAKQFFSLVFFSKFSSEVNAEQLASTIGNTGIDMLSGIVGNFISKQIKYADVGVIYKSADNSHSAEYGINASIPLLNDRIVIETNLGYSDDKTVENSASNFIGDVSIEYLITESGNWRVKIFNFNDEYSTLDLTTKNSQGVGIALIYKQEFNNAKDIRESFRRKSKTNQNLKKIKNEKERK